MNVKKDTMTDEVLVKVKGVSKKFCKSLKRSMLYGVQDIVSDALGINSFREGLREDEFWAVDDISFELRRGECLGLIGPNGAGKSSLLKVLNGIIPPDRGRAEIRGRVGALIEIGAGFHPMLTGRENVYINGSILGFNKREIAKKFDEIVEFSELREFIDTPVKHYSSGMYVRLGFAIAAQMEPDVFLVDEVLAVGDVAFRAKCFNVINHMMRRAAVILVSHNMPDISRVCSEIMVLNRGKSEFHGNDVTRGIDYYYSQFESEKVSVSGSGRATIEKIELASKGKKNIEQINYLDNLDVHLYAKIDPGIIYPTVTITFYNRNLQHIAQWCSLYQNIEIINRNEQLNIIVKFIEINLSPDTYYITVSILDSGNREVLARHFTAKKLIIIGNFASYSPIQLRADSVVEQEHM